MILRLWHGWTLPDDADAYERLLRAEILPGIGRRAGAELQGVQLLRRDAGNETEFVTLFWFSSLDAVRAFAGEDYETAVVPPQAQRLLSRYDARSVHYDVREGAPPAPAG